MRRAVDEFDQTIVMVTHDPDAGGYADRVVFLADGKIVDEMLEPTSRARARPAEEHRGMPRVRQAHGEGALRPQACASLTALAVMLGVSFVRALVLADSAQRDVRRPVRRGQPRDIDPR